MSLSSERIPCECKREGWSYYNTLIYSHPFKMEDEELQAIRRARMQQIRGGGAGGGGGGEGSGPSGSFLDSIGASGGGNGGNGGRGGNDDNGEQQQKMAQMEEQKRQMLSTILDNDARERRESVRVRNCIADAGEESDLIALFRRLVSRISLVKPQKAQGITNLLIQMAQSGQIRQRVNEEQLIGLLEQVERSQGEGSAGGAGKITINRKKQVFDDDDDDFDL